MCDLCHLPYPLRMQGCLADEKCLFWSWCPAAVSAGCAVAGPNGTTAQTLPGTTCILSWDTSKDTLAVFAMVRLAGG